MEQLTKSARRSGWSVGEAGMIERLAMMLSNENERKEEGKQNPSREGRHIFHNFNAPTQDSFGSWFAGLLWICDKWSYRLDRRGGLASVFFFLQPIHSSHLTGSQIVQRESW